MGNKFKKIYRVFCRILWTEMSKNYLYTTQFAYEQQKGIKIAYVFFETKRDV